MSNKGIMRFKNLREVNTYGMAYVPIYCFPFAYLFTNLVLGPTRKSHAGYRHFWSMMSLALPLTCWVGYTLPLPRKIHTDILAANDSDGTYVR